MEHSAPPKRYTRPDMRERRDKGVQRRSVVSVNVRRSDEKKFEGDWVW